MDFNWTPQGVWELLGLLNAMIAIMAALLAAYATSTGRKQLMLRSIIAMFVCLVLGWCLSLDVISGLAAISLQFLGIVIIGLIRLLFQLVGTYNSTKKF